MTVVKGYFQHVRPGVNGPMMIKVPCRECRRWHTHGDGQISEKRTPVGDLTHRSGHCYDRNAYPDGYWIEIQPEPYRSKWSTPRGMISAAYPD
jgi:hypothetical protein